MEKRKSITGILKYFAKEQPSKTALVIDGISVCYYDFYRQVTSAASFLLRKGIKKGSHVVTVASPTIDYVVTEYAILGIGAVNIPTENRIPSDRLGEIAKTVDANFIISNVRPESDAVWMDYSEIDKSKEVDFSWEPVGVSDDCSEIIFTTGTTGQSKGVMLTSHCLETYLAAINPTFKLKNDSRIINH